MSASIENPAAIELAFRVAERRAPNRAAANAVRAAHVRWADEPMLGDLSPLSGAMMVAEAYGVEAPLLASVGEVIEDAALQSASEEVGVPATPEDETYLSQAMTAIKATPERARELMNWYAARAPTLVAARAIRDAGESWSEAAAKASVDAKSRINKAAKEGLDLLKETVDAGSKVANTVALVALVGTGIVLWSLYGPSGKK